MKDPQKVVMQFNDCINRRDLDGLAALMTRDHTFIDSSDEVHRGQEHMVAGWAEFFRLYPDYQNHFTHLESRGNLVLVVGYSTCTFAPLDGPALWTATIRNNQVAEWRVYLDTPENRARLQLA